MPKNLSKRYKSMKRRDYKGGSFFFPYSRFKRDAEEEYQEVIMPLRPRLTFKDKEDWPNSNGPDRHPWMNTELIRDKLLLEPIIDSIDPVLIEFSPWPSDKITSFDKNIWNEDGTGKTVDVTINVRDRDFKYTLEGVGFKYDAFKEGPRRPKILVIEGFNITYKILSEMIKGPIQNGHKELEDFGDMGFVIINVNDYQFASHDQSGVFKVNSSIDAFINHMASGKNEDLVFIESSDDTQSMNELIRQLTEFTDVYSNTMDNKGIRYIQKHTKETRGGKSKKIKKLKKSKRSKRKFKKSSKKIYKKRK